MRLEKVKTKRGSGICHRFVASRLLTKKLVARQFLCGMSFSGSVFAALLLAACAPAQNPPSLSVSSISPSSDIVVRRSAVAPNAKSTIGGSSLVNGKMARPAIAASILAMCFNKILPDVSSGNNDVAASLIETIIWQIQTGPAPPAPVDPVVPEGQDPSLTEDALKVAFALLSVRWLHHRLNRHLNYHQNKMCNCGLACWCH